MKFADKYEIVDKIPPGRVETFVARNVVTGERVLLHIFESEEAEPAPNSPLESRASLSSNTPSEKGVFSYSVTNKNSLETWREPSGRDAGPPSRNEQALFIEPKPAVSDEMPAPRSVALSAPDDEPGEFTKQFFAESRKSRGLTNVSLSSSTPESFIPGALRAEPAAESSPHFSWGVLGSEKETPFSEVQDDFSVQPYAGYSLKANESVKVKSLKPQHTDAESFTDFFRGPFDGEKPAEVPEFSSRPAGRSLSAPPGEFTSVFGKEGGGKAAPRDAASSTGNPTHQSGPGESIEGAFDIHQSLQHQALQPQVVKPNADVYLTPVKKPAAPSS
jgi:hypothetical protein